MFIAFCLFCFLVTPWVLGWYLTTGALLIVSLIFVVMVVSHLVENKPAGGKWFVDWVPLSLASIPLAIAWLGHTLRDHSVPVWAFVVSLWDTIHPYILR